MDNLLNKDCNKHNETDAARLDNHKITNNNKRNPQFLEEDSVNMSKI